MVYLVMNIDGNIDVLVVQHMKVPYNNSQEPVGASDEVSEVAEHMHPQSQKKHPAKTHVDRRGRIATAS